MTTINRATWTDDDGSGMTGTIINNARLQGDVYDRVDGALATLDAKDISQDAAIAANGPHSILSATHTDTTPAGLVAGDMLVVGAGGKLVRLPKGLDYAALVLAGGVPAWSPAPIGQWSSYQLSAATLTSATGTLTLPGGQASFGYTYAIVGKIAFINISMGPFTTSAATAWVRVTLPAALVPILSTNQLCTFYVTASTLTICNIAGGGVGLTWYPNITQTGTIPATTGLYLNATLTFGLV